MKKIFSMVFVVFLSGCSFSEIYGTNHRGEYDDNRTLQENSNNSSLIRNPRISGSTRSGSISGRASTNIGGANIGVRANSRNGDTDFRPSIRSKFFNWSFR